MYDTVKAMVHDLLKNDSSGHGSDHVFRVYNMAMTFAKEENEGLKSQKKEPLNFEVVALTALLHDADDYKLFGKIYAKELINAKTIMEKVHVSALIQEHVLKAISSMGFSKYLSGIRPTTLEGMIVSDADMCEAMGATGIIRSVVYAVSSKGNGVLFDRNVYPNVNISLEEYNGDGEQTTHDTDSAINHFYEKMLKLSDLMMTKAGKKESIARRQIMVDFLRHFYKEERADEWLIYLDNFLRQETDYFI